MLAAVLAASGSALAAQTPRATRTTLATRTTRATKTVRYHGIGLRIPAAWPVFHLGARSSTCVRFNRHALYLGRPGDSESCSLNVAGRTEAILVTPMPYRESPLAPVSVLAAGASGGSLARLENRAHRLVITATWGRHPAIIRRALSLRSLRPAMLATNGHRPQPAPMPLRSAQLLGRVTSPESPATPGEVYAGLGFDACSTPSTTAMSAWGAKSPYAAVGVYIGGADLASCNRSSLTPAWVQAESAAGWHIIPIYVGLQAPGNGCGCSPLSAALTNGQYATAAAQGTAAAQDAVAQAQALGIGAGNPIYYDMENYRRTTTVTGAVLTFLQAWTVQLHASGYLSGVYSSGSSGITDLVHSYGTTYVEPDELWTAAWDSSAPGTPPTSPANAYVPAADWPGNHQLLQYYADSEGKAETYGGVTIGVDRDYLDAPTAAYGSGTLVSLTGTTPTLGIRPQADGSVNLTPHWAGEAGISAYNILAGESSKAAMTAVDGAPANTKFPVKLRAVYPYYEVQGLNSLGQVVGTSAPIQTPASIAIFGHSGYVGARGPVGIPVACLNLKPCQLEAQIFDGKRRIAHSSLTGISAHGGQLSVPLSAHTRRLVTAAAGHQLAVTVTLTSATGAKVSRPLNLVAYTISGRSPTRRTWPSSVLQILGSTSYVSSAWTGGVLAVCRASVPCAATVSVTLAGAALAKLRTTTLGPGELGYLTYGLNNHGHKLLRAALGNQLGARLTVSTTMPSSTPAPPVTTTTPTTPSTNPPPSGGSPPANSGGAGIASARAAAGTRMTMALISLVAFR